MNILKDATKIKKKVGIVSAGPSGLCAAHRSLEVGHDVVIFEKCSQVGGTWIYTPEVGVHSSMYENLITNGPKEIMGYERHPFPGVDNSGRSFVPSESVLEYLENFSKSLQPYIKFHHKVKRVVRKYPHWVVDVEKLDSNANQEIETYLFDVLFVCNGHFSKPNLPDYYERYQKHWIHSHDYRHPKKFEGQTVAIVGTAFSGMDILPQIAKVAKKIYLLHNNVGKFASILPSHVSERPRPTDATHDTLILSDGSTLDDVDTIIYCTGYIYDFPFFHHQDSIIQVLHQGKMISPLFEHVAHVHYIDSLFFIGLTIASTFPMCEYHVRFALALVAGRHNISRIIIEGFEANRMKKLEESGQPIKNFHIPKDQFAYYRKLCEYTNLPYYTTKVFEKIAVLQAQARSLDYLSYKKIRYYVIDDENFVYEI